MNTAQAENLGKNYEFTNIQISAGEWPPFLSESLPNKGIIAHLISDIFNEAGIQVEFEFLPWVRAFEVTAQGEYSATSIWMYKKDRTTDFLYSEPVLSEKFVFFHLKDTPFDWNEMNDLRGKSIGGVLGYSYGPKFDAALEEGVFKQLRLPTVDQNLRMLAAGRTDIYAEEMSVANYTLLKRTPELADLITYHPKPILENQSFLLFPKKGPNSKALLEIFNSHLEGFKQDGRYDTYFTE
ncbi:substrate-binding periplasmic protein [Reinekea sp.]|uniref:substrate-binding periplasmic protein n=2 Tax=Reinekea sp. TaxID=1970455 RepID=UPI0039896E39